jgi:hypothetical protein
LDRIKINETTEIIENRIVGGQKSVRERMVMSVKRGVIRRGLCLGVLPHPRSLFALVGVAREK